MIDSLLFLAFSLFYPHRIDFIRMGLGIKARFEKNQKQWSNHHELVHKFITEALNTLLPDKNRSILILGCGRLFDFPLTEFERFNTVTLVDADPLGLFLAKKKVRKIKDLHVEAVCCDVTGIIDALAKTKSIPKVCEGLLNFGSYDVVISLNLLGQIPLYFLDRAEKLKLPCTEKELLDFSDAIQSAHVKAVVAKSTQLSVFIYDKTFYFYEPDQAPWQEVAAIKEDVFDSCQEKIVSFDKWYWAVDQGAMHLIEARAIRK